MELDIKERFTKRLFDFPLTGRGILPAGEADEADDFVDLGDDALDDDGCLFIAHLFKEFGEGGFAAILVLFRGHVFL